MPEKKPTLIDIFQQTLADVMSKQEFLAAFRNVVDRVKAVETKLTRDFAALRDTISGIAENVRTEAASAIADLKKQTTALVGRVDTKLSEVDVKLASIRIPEDGQDAKPEDVVPLVMAQIKLPEQKEIILDTPEDIRNKLEVLQGDERLKAEAISGLEGLIADIKALKGRPIVVPGRSLLQLYVNGTKRGAVQYLNITGSGVSYAFANGRNDVTITGGGGSLSVLAATGTVNDNNKTFTFVSTPTLVNVNGATYTNGHGCTIVTTTVTLDNAPGTNGFVYGLG